MVFNLAGPFDHLAVAEASMDLTGFQFSDLLHPQPRGLDSENASIEFVILNVRNFRIPAVPTHYEAGMPSFIFTINARRLGG